MRQSETKCAHSGTYRALPYLSESLAYESVVQASALDIFPRLCRQIAVILIRRSKGV